MKDYDHIWRDAFMRATPVVFNMVCVLLLGLAPLYFILRTQIQMKQILTTSTTELYESDSIRDIPDISIDEESFYE